MPNWISNKLVVKATGSELEKIVKFVGSEDSEFDFDKIIPRPKELNIGAFGESTIEEYIYKYLFVVNPDTPRYPAFKKYTREKYLQVLSDYVSPYYNKAVYELQNKVLALGATFQSEIEKAQKSYIETDSGLNDGTFTRKELIEEFGPAFENVVALYGLYLDNLIKYGCLNWYNWCVKNWGVKWNASYVSYGEGVFYFQTPWSTPFPVIVELSKKFPKVEFTLFFYDEDVGNDNNAGLVFLNGEYNDLELSLENILEEFGESLSDYYDEEDISGEENEE